MSNEPIAWVVNILKGLTAYVYTDGSVMMPFGGKLIAPTPEEESAARVEAIKHAVAEMRSARDALKSVSSELDGYDAISEAITVLEATVGS